MAEAEKETLMDPLGGSEGTCREQRRGRRGCQEGRRGDLMPSAEEEKRT